MKITGTKTLQSTQLKFCKTVTVPMLTSAIEKRQDNDESAEISFQRPVAGYTLLNQKRSTDMCSELEIFSLIAIMGRQKENWYEHIVP
jgi:hypothetical protein